MRYEKLVVVAATLGVPCKAFSPINLRAPTRRDSDIKRNVLSPFPYKYPLLSRPTSPSLQVKVREESLRQTKTRHYTFKSSTAEFPEEENKENSPTNNIIIKNAWITDDSSPTLAQVLSSALLVSGTTVGGGFLALPSVVAGSGFYPSATTLFGVWTYFLAQSFILVECIRRTEQKTSSPPGVAAVAKSMFGPRGEMFIGVLLAILIEATLVSQISRAGMLFPNYALGCAVSSISIAAIVFGPKAGVTFASKANSVLTTLFLLSAISVFGCGVGIADWSRLGSSGSWSSVPSAVPTFLQLLVYGEIVPTVCQILKYSTRHIHAAIVLGSLMTLCLQIGWSGLGIALVPDASIMDPVNVLLAGSGPVKIPLFSLAITAILTTILGSYLALLSTANDFIRRGTVGSDNERDANSKSENKNSSSLEESLGQRIKIAALITIPATMIASTSPSIFLKAIDFAGSYPVLLLWGVIPPVIALLQRKETMRDNDKGDDDGQVHSSQQLNTSGPSTWLLTLASVSLGLVGINAYQDVASVAKRLLN